MLTFVMGITLAIGVITVFNQYREDVTETAEKEEAVIAASKLENAIFQVKNSDSGSRTVELPENLGGQEYTVALDRQVRVLTPTENYSKELNIPGRFEGTAEGGTVKIYKSGDKYTLRAQ